MTLAACWSLPMERVHSVRCTPWHIYYHHLGSARRSVADSPTCQPAALARCVHSQRAARRSLVLIEVILAPRCGLRQATPPSTGVLSPSVWKKN